VTTTHQAAIILIHSIAGVLGAPVSSPTVIHAALDGRIGKRFENSERRTAAEVSCYLDRRPGRRKTDVGCYSLGGADFATALEHARLVEAAARMAEQCERVFASPDVLGVTYEQIAEYLNGLGKSLDEVKSALGL
jgi:hypothetical protein